MRRADTASRPPNRSPDRGLRPRPAASPPPQLKKKSKRHRSTTKWRLCRTRLRHRPCRSERNGAATTPARVPRADRAHRTSAPHRTSSVSPALRSAGKPPELLQTWAVGLGAGRAGRLRGAARQTIGGSVGQIRPPRATDDSECCATPALRREMEAAPRVSAAPRGHWRRRRPRPSPGNPGGCSKGKRLSQGVFEMKKTSGS
uniref:uncharacterized protein LOC129121854 n=1 Tax=Agelaius phoeniceus TaxID=39638 RepID=UPI0023EDE0E7|nr:uncharacterized protein LOC129121854 [Agelaius phoeniceus]